MQRFLLRCMDRLVDEIVALVWVALEIVEFVGPVWKTADILPVASADSTGVFVFEVYRVVPRFGFAMKRRAVAVTGYSRFLRRLLFEADKIEYGWQEIVIAHEKI